MTKYYVMRPEIGPIRLTDGFMLLPRCNITSSLRWMPTFMFYTGIVCTIYRCVICFCFAHTKKVYIFRPDTLHSLNLSICNLFSLCAFPYII